MEAVGAILVWILISLPFLFLAYTIFLLRENTKLQYGSVYKRAAIIFVLFAGVVAAYYYIPYMLRPASVPMPDGKEQGTFVNNSGDTLILNSGTLTLLHNDPVANGKGTYRIYRPAAVQNPTTGSFTFSDAFRNYNYQEPYSKKLLDHFSMEKAALQDPVIELSYTRASASTILNQKKSRKGQTTPQISYTNVTENYTIRFSGENMILKGVTYNGYNVGEKTFRRL